MHLTWFDSQDISGLFGLVLQPCEAKRESMLILISKSANIAIMQNGRTQAPQLLFLPQNVITSQLCLKEETSITIINSALKSAFLHSKFGYITRQLFQQFHVCCCDKYTNQNNFGEERVYLA